MDQSTKHKIDFNDAFLIQPTQTIVEQRNKRIRCSECNKKRTPSADENHQICHVCYKAKAISKQSGNKIINDFIKYTQTNYVKKEGKMEFVPHEQFKNIEFIAEGGFSKIYKATWTDGPVISYKNKRDIRDRNCTVVLKKLNNSKNITS